MGDLRPDIDDALDAFGLAAGVTRPSPANTPIATTGFWVSPLEEPRPAGRTMGRLDPRKVFVLPKADVPTLPLGTLIVAAEIEGGAARTWKVDDLEKATRPDEWRAIVVIPPA